MVAESAEQSDSGTSPVSVVFLRAIAGEDREGSKEGRGSLKALKDKENVDGAWRSKDQGSGWCIPAKYKYRASAPAHRWIRENPLSSDAIFKQSHVGLLNLCIVVPIAVNGRLIIENLMKYGLLVRAGFWFSSKSLRDWPVLMYCLTLPLFPLVAFLIEKLAWRKFTSEINREWLLR